ncbi:hypothetical protein DV736_g176, partial [Chaetothyriales sp. CBS 134916]
MLDENLPTFLLKPSSDKPKQSSALLFSQHGSEFEPRYAVRHPDPDQHASRNRYAAALSDAYNADVLYAEVLLIPEWTQPAVHSDQRGAGAAVPPPPEPVLPEKFVIQLYNPDQQVTVRHKPASWNSAAAWEFELPQQTFRAPSASALDRSQHDPAGSDVTPRIGFKWKKDSKLSKDLACFLSGKVLNADGSKKKSKEPDITVAIFKALKEVTLYEPNLIRVDVEDAKGLEVVLLLGAVVIRDVYFGPMKEAFNLDAGRKTSTTSPRVTAAVVPGSLAIPVSQSPPPADHDGGRDPRVPPTDPRSQWEIDAETERLRRLAVDEERRRKKREGEQERQLRRMLEAEEREERRRQAEIDQETERLRRLYGAPGPGPARPQRPHQASAASGQYLDPQRRQSALVPHEAAAQQHYYPSTTAWGSYNAGPYMSGGATASQSGPLNPTSGQALRLKNKSSIFSFRRHSDQESSKLTKKRSAVF